MCVYSMIIDHKIERWEPYTTGSLKILPSKEEIDEFYTLLDRAREYDKRTNQPNCEDEDKIRRLQEIAKILGFELKLTPLKKEKNKRQKFEAILELVGKDHKKSLSNNG